MLESFKWSCKPLTCKFFKKRLQLNCFTVKFSKCLRVYILKNICKWLLLGVFYKKLVLRNFTIFTGQKSLVISEEIYQFVNIMWLLLTWWYLCLGLFLILSIRKFSEHLFWRTFANGCFWKGVCENYS